MKQFDFKKYLKNNPLLKESINEATSISKGESVFGGETNQAAKKSPAEKAKITKQLNIIKDRAQSEAEEELGLKGDPKTGENMHQTLLNMQLAMGWGPKVGKAELQKKYNKIVIDKIEKYAKDAKIDDADAIKNSYYNMDHSQWV